MAEKIVIELDLDNTDYKKNLSDVEKETIESSSKIGKSFDDNIASIINKKIIVSIDKLNNKFEEVVSVASKASAAFNVAIPAFIFLEKQFGIFSGLLKRIGIDLDQVIFRSNRLIESFRGFIIGEKSLNDVKLAASLLLYELKLIDSFALGIISKFDKISNAVSNSIFIMQRISTAIESAFPALVFLEKRFNVISILANQIGFNFKLIVLYANELKQSFEGFKTGEEGLFGVLYYSNLLMHELKLVDNTALKVIDTVSRYPEEFTVAFVALGSLAKYVIDNFDKISYSSTQAINRLVKSMPYFVQDARNLGLQASRSIDAFTTSIYNSIRSFRSLSLSTSLYLTQLRMTEYSTKAFASSVKMASAAFTSYSSSISSISQASIKTASDMVGLRGVLLKTALDAKDVGVKLFETFARPKGLLELTSLLGMVSGALFLTSENMIHSENATTRWIGTLLKLGAIITGGLSTWISIAIFKIADLAQVIGGKLIQYFQQASDKFIKTSSSIEIFNAAIDTMNRSTSGAVGTSQEWLATIEELSRSLNISSSLLNKSAQEIVLVGEGMGLTTDQMKELLKISSEYAKINHKDVFETTVALVNALNGNSQSVQALGIKLGEASVQQYLFSKGITETMSKMSESEKIQARYNKLLSQYNSISGLGSVAANTLADQQERLKINTERLSVALGKGAAIIEQNNVVAYLLNTVLNNVNETILTATGFFGALGSRLLQAGGFVLEFTFKTFALAKALALLDVLFKSRTWDDFSNRKLPLIGKSFNDLLVLITGSDVKIKSSRDLLFTIGEAAINQVKSLVGLQAGVSGSVSLFSQIMKIFKENLKSLLLFISPLLAPLAKLGAIFALITAPVILLKNAIQELESRTKIFSSLYQIFANEIARSSAFFEPVLSFFSSLKDSIIELGSKAFGILIYGLSKVVSAFNYLVASNPFKIFSDETINKIAIVNGNLNAFSQQLKTVAFDISKIPAEASRAIASTTDKLTVNIEELVNKLNQLRDQYKDFGLTDVEKIRANQQESLEVLRLSFENKLIAEKEYLDLKEKINIDAAERIKALEQKSAQNRQRALEQTNEMLRNAMARAISDGIQNIVKSLVNGENVLKNFGQFVLITFADLAIQLGQFFIGFGVAFEAFKSLGSPGAMVAAGAALVALGSIIKAFSEKGLKGPSSSGVASIGAQPSAGQISTPTDLAKPDSIDEERLKPQTNVQVVVQGSLVHQEELGDFITRTLNESFGKQGVALTDARFA